MTLHPRVDNGITQDEFHGITQDWSVIVYNFQMVLITYGYGRQLDIAI